MNTKVIQFKFAILFILIIPTFSCKKDSHTNEETNYKNFTQIFDSFWENMYKRYILWDIDTTDTEAKKKEFRLKFMKLNLNNPQDIEKSVVYFEEMTRNLKDNHFNMVFQISPVRGRAIFPSLARKMSAPDFPVPLSYADIDIKYLDDGYRSSSGHFDPEINSSLKILTGTINKNIIYFNFNAFKLVKTSRLNQEIRNTLNYFFESLQHNTNAIKGIIIDVRGNRGGDLIDLNFLIGKMIRKKLTFGYFRYKNGANKLDFSPWVEAIIDPSTSGSEFLKPIVVLCDRYSASVSESLAFAVKALPSGVVIGEETWGATCPVTDPSLFNTGSFELPGFADVTMSSVAFKYIDDKVYEDKGVNPSIYVAPNPELIKLGIDNQLEAAIKYIKKESISANIQ